MPSLKGLYPGIQEGGTLPLQNLQGAGVLTFGSVFFVHSVTGSDTANAGTTPEAPLATIDAAIGKCTAGKNDVIFVLPKHVETLATAGAIAADIADISIIGLGNGNSRPTLTLSATASTIAVSAANVLFRNIVITGSVAELVTVFNITAAGCTLDAVDFHGGATSTIKFLTTSLAATFLTIKNCHHDTTAAVTANAWWLQLTGCDDVRIVDNYFNIVTSNNAASGIIGGLTTASLRVFIKNNELYNLGTSPLTLSMLAGSTGLLSYNNIGGSKTAAAGAVQPASCYCTNNYVTNVTSTSGKLDPVATA
jgi:hypothetical protein